ncbi:MAG: hypothetical protein K0M66_08620 [Thiobacillus sp.]|nr:hypothetical protein [Thiobacillus sp.]
MDRDAIIEIGIDDKGRLYLTPSTKAFPYIYREAMEVHWDDQGHYLHAPLPARAQLAQPIWWFERILAAAREQDCELYIDQQTKWHNVPVQLKSEILSITGAAHA